MRLFGYTKYITTKKALWFCKKGFDVARKDWPDGYRLTFAHSRFELHCGDTVLCPFWTPRRADKYGRNWHVI